MIEIENEKNRNLKNLKQIGTPREEGRVYIENSAYNKIKEDSHKEKKVYVMMGHTERMQGRYATFVEAVIPVRDMEFSGLVPKWNNALWSEVFREIKRLYENMIIVGWAVDLKGMSPKLNPDIERVHREHFGGVHQLLFLLDSIEREETFYIYKENKIVSKDGFYIYHKAQRKEPIPITVLPEKRPQLQSEEPEVDVEVNLQEPLYSNKGKYRQQMQGKKNQEKDGGSLGLAAAVAMLVFVIGVGVYENNGSLLKGLQSIETNLLQESTQEEGETAGEEDDSDDTETSGDKIEIEVVPGTE